MRDREKQHKIDDQKSKQKKMHGRIHDGMSSNTKLLRYA